MLTGRRVDADQGGHGVTWNEELPGRTVPGPDGDGVASVFDVVHAAGGTTALFAGKDKFATFERSWPDTLDEWLTQCHEAGQTKSTAILLKYGPKDWNALHRDLYGDLVFPLQVVINLNEPGIDHTGGEFLLLEQRPRAQSRGTSTLLPHGHGYLFTTRDRPVQSTRGWSAAPVRHGVSAIRSGERHTLALVFHDAA
jgi:hypothetical protein